MYVYVRSLHNPMDVHVGESPNAIHRHQGSAAVGRIEPGPLAEGKELAEHQTRGVSGGVTWHHHVASPIGNHFKVSRYTWVYIDQFAKNPYLLRLVRFGSHESLITV